MAVNNAMLLPDAPRANKACRICQLVAVSDEWAKLLYVYRFEKQMPLRDLVKAMEPHITEWNKNNPKQQLLPFSTKAASKHFSKHVPSTLQMQYQLQNQTGSVKRATAQKQVSPVVNQHVQQQVTKSVAVFEELNDLYTKLKKLFEEYLQRNQSITVLSIHLDIIREMRKTLAEIGKMRQSKELVKIAVRSVIDTFLGKVIDDAGRAIEELHGKLARKTDPQFAAQITQEFRQVMTNAVIEAAKQAILQVRREFALNEDGDGE